ncbi:DUF397 domain-containing protein [Streptomyces sp. SID3343]|nr:DUF397 domain-containing protein [Streptomyces sp. SID3343]MYV98951.1 DUF397 domain-containing protein [Streptomyces sp. SID3343]
MISTTAILTWRKSSRSTSDTHCVEVASDGASAHARDSKISQGPEIRFRREPWGAFVDALR